jgi:hypothetical protein
MVEYVRTALVAVVLIGGFGACLAMGLGWRLRSRPANLLH